MDALPLIFQAIDLDDDGQISYYEFKLFFRSFDVSDEKFTKEVNFLYILFSYSQDDATLMTEKKLCREKNKKK